MKLVSVSEMQAIEKEADSGGLDFAKMMENAGNNLAREVLAIPLYKDEGDEIQVLGLVGGGNNGGDTLIALTRLAEKGWTSRAYLVNRKISEDALIESFKSSGGEVYSASDDENFQNLTAFLDTTDIILDGILGTGFSLPLREEISVVLSTIKKILATNEVSAHVIAVDCPSGVNCETGEAAVESIPADATYTMAALKMGLLKLPAFELTGEIHVIEIGDLSNSLKWQAVMNEVADDDMIAKILPKRAFDAHKGSFGTAIITAGSLNYTGAALLAGRACARIGAGLVTIAIPSPLHSALSGHFPEATWILLPHEMGVISEAAADVLTREIAAASVLLLGPGLGLEDTTGAFVRKLITNKQKENTGSRRIGFIKEESNQKVRSDERGFPPLVIDADGLKLLAKIEGWHGLIPAPAILTPHPGEMAILTSLPVEEIQSDRLNIARKYSSQWGHVVVLKGAFTVIASPDGRTTTIPIATSALAHAGTGDVLAGLITGLRAQKLEAYDAAIAGAWIHARAGIIAAELLTSPAAVLAGDVLDCVADILGNYS